jgi:hypothetical protein
MIFVLTMILCNIVMYEMVKKYYKLYSLIHDPDENVVIRVLPLGGLDRLPGLTWSLMWLVSIGWQVDSELG